MQVVRERRAKRSTEGVGAAFVRMGGLAKVALGGLAAGLVAGGVTGIVRNFGEIAADIFRDSVGSSVDRSDASVLP